MDIENSIQLSELPITPVDPDSPVPLYYQIEEDLRRLINSGKIPPMTTMPPEMALCQAYGVGRHTIRMALSRLVADDLISRQAGRGTFVKAHTQRLQITLATRGLHQAALACCAIARFTPDSTALSEAVTMFGSMPTPNSGPWSPTRRSI